MKIIKKLTAILMVLMLVFSIAACSGDNSNTSSPAPSSSTESSSSEVAVAKKKLTLNVDNMGQTYTLNIETSGSTLYDALKENELIEGSEGQYGFFVTGFNGVTADGSDGTYWMFKDGEGNFYPTGVETTEIKDGDVINIVRSKS